ncbi:MAG: zinc-dependent metalloprotease, partial [Thermoleophilaceae bacterium]
RLLGMEMKMRQYREGKAFCDAVVASGGPALLRGVWDGPEALPDARELGHPERWLARRSAATT